MVKAIDVQEASASDEMSERRLIPASQWNAYHAWPPQGVLRHLIFNAENNGFEKVIKRIGRRILIDERAFFQWVDEQA